LPTSQLNRKPIALLVASCDAYSDLWPPFFDHLRRFWPGCRLKTYLLSNTMRSGLPGVQTLLIQPDESWSGSLQEALRRIEEDYVFLFLDDLFLVSAVREPAVNQVLDWAVQTRANYVRFSPAPKPDRRIDALVGAISPGAIYRASTVLSLWKKQVLMDLLVPGESAWAFEVHGSTRSDAYDGFYCTWERHIPIVNGVIKGKWVGSAVRSLKALGTPVDLARRPMLTLREALGLELLEMRSRLLRLFPGRFQRRIKHAVLRGRYSYRAIGRHRS
jgi:hypothetical protein